MSNTNTLAPTMAEAQAIIDDLTKYDSVADANKALQYLRDVVDGVDSALGGGTQERLNAASMLYQVSMARAQLGLQALEIAQRQAAAATPDAQH